MAQNKKSSPSEIYLPSLTFSLFFLLLVIVNTFLHLTINALNIWTYLISTSLLLVFFLVNFMKIRSDFYDSKKTLIKVYSLEQPSYASYYKDHKMNANNSDGAFIETIPKDLVINVILALLVFTFFLLCLDFGVTPLNLNYFIYFISCLGILVIYLKPFSRLYKMASAIDVGVGAFAVLIFIFHFMEAFIVPKVLTSESTTEPCQSESIQQRCYNVSPNICKNIWTQIEKNCEFEMQSTMSSRGPTALIGPIVYKCRVKNFDKIMRYNRKTPEDPKCFDFFEKIKNYE